MHYLSTKMQLNLKLSYDVKKILLCSAKFTDIKQCDHL